MNYYYICVQFYIFFEMVQFYIFFQARILVKRSRSGVLISKLVWMFCLFYNYLVFHILFQTIRVFVGVEIPLVSEYFVLGYLYQFFCFNFIFSVSFSIASQISGYFTALGMYRTVLEGGGENITVKLIFLL